MIVAKEKPIIYAKSERVKEDMDSILNTSKPRNADNVNELNKAADYIFKKFKLVSDDVSFQKFTVDNKEYKNVICSINTDKKERIIIGAHYDVCGNQHGADDNASGVCGMLELARLLKDKELNYRIDFVAYTLEEPPYFGTEQMGSYIHAKSLFENNVQVKGMISIEMIGYFSDKDKSQHYPIPLLKYIYGSKGDFITIVKKFNAGKFANSISKKIMKNPSIKTIVFQGPKALPGIDFSDHRNYWKFGYSSIMITNTAFYRNANYHQSTDNIETINFDKMCLVINQLYEGLLKLN
ncbi:MAG: M28 family peptidase [Chitinophagaceae bacterium]|nr:M28 family peptidase [Chitinophagaceae bacterium]